MRAPVWVLLLSLSATAGSAVAQTSRAPLPSDIDAQSQSRLPLILKDTLDQEGRRIFEAINGKDSNTPRLGPPASTMHSLAAAEPYDRLTPVAAKRQRHRAAVIRDQHARAGARVQSAIRVDRA